MSALRIAIQDVAEDKREAVRALASGVDEFCYLFLDPMKWREARQIALTSKPRKVIPPAEVKRKPCNCGRGKNGDTRGNG